jgi:hypothetical protein
LGDYNGKGGWGKSNPVAVRAIISNLPDMDAAFGVFLLYRFGDLKYNAPRDQKVTRRVFDLLVLVPSGAKPPRSKDG